MVRRVVAQSAWDSEAGLDTEEVALQTGIASSLGIVADGVGEAGIVAAEGADVGVEDVEMADVEIVLGSAP